MGDVKILTGKKEWVGSHFHNFLFTDEKFDGSSYKFLFRVQLGS